MSNKTASAIASAAATAASIHLMVNESVLIVNEKHFIQKFNERKITHIKSNNFNNVEAGNLPPLVSRLVAVILFQAAKLRK